MGPVQARKAPEDDPTLTQDDIDELYPRPEGEDPSDEEHTSEEEEEEEDDE